MNKENTVDFCLLTVGGIYSLANIREILGIIILVIQLLWILSKFIIKIINKVKSKKNLSTIGEDVSSVIDELKALQDLTKSEEEHKDE